MRRRKISFLLGATVFMVVLSAGCSSNSTAQSENTETQEINAEAEAQTAALTVQVTEISGSTITAETGDLESQNASGAPDGIAPSKKPDGEAPANISEGESPRDNGDNKAPAEMPEAEAPRDAEGGEPPADMPEGETSYNPGGMGGNAPADFGRMTFTGSGEIVTFEITDATNITVEFLQGSQEGTLDDVSVGSVLEVTLDDQNQAEEITVKNLSAGGGFGGSDEITNGTSSNTIEEDSSIDGATYTSDGDDENALRVDGSETSLENIVIEKTGGKSSNTENGDFYGQNAGLLALNGANVTITNATVNTSAVNGNGVFSYGEGTTVTISDSVIRTTENNSGGIQTTGGGITYASNLDVETQGNSAAAIRSDRGGGTVEVNGGTYVTNGTGSPAVYCTADISVSNAVLTANASEGIVVEGKNSVSLTDCDMTANMENTYNGDAEENIHTIMIYQSMSGDAAIGEASFSAEGGSITSKTGDMFYITNTDCTINLKNVAFTLANDTFLRVEGNSSSRGWGTEGANGGDVVLNADAQNINGNILVDDISSLNFQMSGGSTFTGAVNPDGEAGEVNVVLDENSVWILTGDSYITSFDGDITNVTANGFHLYVNGEEML